MQTGTLILLVGPSGSGKGTLVSFLRKEFPELIFPTSWTTRPPRPGEEAGTSASGKKYHFVSEEEFAAHAESGAFLEWARYGGHSYGTPRKEVEEALASGRSVLQELEMQGVEQLRTRMPQGVVVIYIDAGSWDELKRRILARGSMSAGDLKRRERRYEEERAFAARADFVVANPFGKIEEAKQALAGIVRSLQSRG